MADVHTTQEFEDTHVTLTPVNLDGQQQSLSVSSQFATSMLNPTPDAGIDSIFETTSQMDVQALTIVAPLTLSTPTLTPSTIATISTIPQAPNPPTTAPSTLLQDLPNFGLLRDEAQAKNEEFLKNLNKNIQKIIKEQVKEQDKALVEAYESDKIILDTYGVVFTLKRRRDDDADKDKEPFAGSDQGSKRRKEGNEPESISAPKEKVTRTTGKSTQGSKSQQRTTSESVPAEEPLQTTHDLEDPSHQEFKTGAADDQPIVEASQHPECDGTLNDVRTALDDHLKGIQMKYLPQTIWRKSDKERATAMIQAIDKQLKTRRIMRSLKRFVGGRLYEGDIRMLQRTI
nr:hypothetical protein [Tanacetum cinerariifolium]GEW50173.1 hypothetical protein [Tanacetum cinerariifolium]